MSEDEEDDTNDVNQIQITQHAPINYDSFDNEPLSAEIPLQTEETQIVSIPNVISANKSHLGDDSEQLLIATENLQQMEQRFSMLNNQLIALQGNVTMLE